MTTAAIRDRVRWNAERKFYLGVSIAMLLVVYVGFARSFFLRPLFPEWEAPTEPIFYVHGILFAGVPVPPLQFLVVPLGDITLFATFVIFAVLARRDPQAHKRWMLLATVNLLAAAFARWPGVPGAGNPFVYFALADLFIVALAVWDFRSRGRLHPVTLWGGLIVIALQPLRLAISGTPAWLAFAGWATGLNG